MNYVGLSSLALQVFTSCLVASATYAAPHPGAGSSALVAPEKGLFWARHGFRLTTGKSGWVIAADSEPTTYQPPAGGVARLEVKVDRLKAENTLENFAKKWMKDYSSYGFELLGSQTFQQKDGAKGLVIDFEHKKSYQQIRQVLFVRGKTAVILTCADDRKNFMKTLEPCNEISKSFTWTQWALPQAN